METNESLVAFTNSEIPWSRSLRFWLLLVFDIPAVAASVLVLVYLLFTPSARSALHNHTVIVLVSLALIFQLIDVSWYLDFARKGIVSPSTPTHCLIWWLVDLGVYNTSALVLAWMSIERHILVFHDRWVAPGLKRFFVHYFPLIGVLLYASIYYVWLIFFPPCEHAFIYDLPVCSATPCHLLHPILGKWEMGVHGCFSTVIITGFSLGLLVRVIFQKRQHNRVFQWRKYRKMTIQLLSVSFLYLLFNLPTMVLWLAQAWGSTTDALVQAQLVTFFLTYWVMLLLPIVSLTSLGDLQHRIRQIFCPKRNNRVTATVTMANVIEQASGRRAC